ncbi:hypothetical protein JCM21714_942 [Gracilibacillus boraciitolerans JCM 21714]|uniref:Uncharacterized protein n=1 Tax=Gracilibacillus boraciitolerans JCM 21714 TaxID=1298598 RepID=W4VF13_9BACI|nr:hypothetical protein [Gracilibacillus boraciitolerans]GAE91970.1 hypothetical protein JCM21714_942 [Gracilibacillus boraciitolerans JCM 21714]
MKRFLVSLLSIMILVAGGGAVNAETIKDHDLNLQELKVEYEEWFKKVVSSKTAREDVIESYNQYNELSEEEKLIYIDYLYNPKLQEVLMDALATEPEVTSGQTTQKIDDYKGIEVTTEVVTPPVTTDKISIMANRTATYNRYVTFLKIKVFQTTSVVDYSHNGTRVTGVGAGDHYVSRNLNPTLNISWSGKRQTYSSTRAQSKVNMQWNFVHKAIGITYGGGELGVWGNHKNKAGGWFNAH